MHKRFQLYFTKAGAIPHTPHLFPEILKGSHGSNLSFPLYLVFPATYEKGEVVNVEMDTDRG